MPLFVLLLAWLTTLACVCWSYWSCWPTNGCIQQWGPAYVKSDAKSDSSVHTTLVYISCRSHGVQQRIGHLWHSYWTAPASQTHSPSAMHLYVHNILTHSHSDNSYMHATAQTMFYTCTHSGLPHNVIHSFSLLSRYCTAVRVIVVSEQMDSFLPVYLGTIT